MPLAGTPLYHGLVTESQQWLRRFRKLWSRGQQPPDKKESIMSIQLVVPYVRQLNIGGHAGTGWNDPTGCWYARAAGR